MFPFECRLKASTSAVVRPLSQGVVESALGGAFIQRGRPPLYVSLYE